MGTRAAKASANIRTKPANSGLSASFATRSAFSSGTSRQVAMRVTSGGAASTSPVSLIARERITI